MPSTKENSTRLMAYVAAGPEILCYDVDRGAGEIALRGSLTLPSNVQYAVADSRSSHLYVATSDREKGISPYGAVHRLVSLQIDRQTGTLRKHGQHQALPDRPIHITIDEQDRHLLIAFSDPAGLRVYHVEANGEVGREVMQPAPLDTGTYPHQVRVVPGNDQAILVARGHDATASKPEEPGALNVFGYIAGQLSADFSVAPKGGYGFGPRHLDFHPSRPWVYVSLERQNKLSVFAFHGNALSPEAIYTRDTLAAPQQRRKRQLAGAIRVHPSGKYVFVVNRADNIVEEAGEKFFAGGENNIAVFGIDSETGEPELLAHVEITGIHCRNFQFDPTGEILAASHIKSFDVKKHDKIESIPPRLSLFQVAADGRTDLLRSHDIPAQGRTVFWMGLVGL